MILAHIVEGILNILGQ